MGTVVLMLDFKTSLLSPLAHNLDEQAATELEEALNAAFGGKGKPRFVAFCMADGAEHDSSIGACDECLEVVLGARRRLLAIAEGEAAERGLQILRGNFHGGDPGK